MRQKVVSFLQMILPLLIRAITVMSIVVLISSVLIEILPLPNNNVLTTINIIRRIEQQQSLAERIDKNILILAYRPQSEHIQAINELQVTLPIFEKIQSGLQSGDASLYLPKRRPQDVQLLLVQSQPDYIAIDTAAKTILGHADSPVDLDEISIMQQHERPYFLAINNAARLWQGHILENSLGFFWTELCLGIVLLSLYIISVILKKIDKWIKKCNDQKQ